MRHHSFPVSTVSFELDFEQLDIVQLNAKVKDGLLYIDYKDDTTISDAFLIGVIVESIVNQTFNQHESKN